MRKITSPPFMGAPIPILVDFKIKIGRRGEETRKKGGKKDRRKEGGKDTRVLEGEAGLRDGDGSGVVGSLR